MRYLLIQLLLGGSREIKCPHLVIQLHGRHSPLAWKTERRFSPNQPCTFLKLTLGYCIVRNLTPSMEDVKLNMTKGSKFFKCTSSTAEVSKTSRNPMSWDKAHITIYSSNLNLVHRQAPKHGLHVWRHTKIHHDGTLSVFQNVHLSINMITVLCTCSMCSARWKHLCTFQLWYLNSHSLCGRFRHIFKSGFVFYLENHIIDSIWKP